MKIAHFISNLVFSFISLLFIYCIYRRFRRCLTSWFYCIFYVYNGRENIFRIQYTLAHLHIRNMHFFIVPTLILLIKNLVKKQNIIASVLAITGIISTDVFYVLNDGLHSKNNPTQYQILCIFTVVIVIVQLIVSLIDTIKSYKLAD